MSAAPAAPVEAAGIGFSGTLGYLPPTKAQMLASWEKVAEFFASNRDLRRDPYYPHVTLASPEGFKEYYSSSVRHNRWLTLNKATKGDLKYDELVSHGDDFDSWRLEHRQSNHRGAMIDAVNHGDNTIAVATQNVARFTLWLHPRIVDVRNGSWSGLTARYGSTTGSGHPWLRPWNRTNGGGTGGWCTLSRSNWTCDADGIHRHPSVEDADHGPTVGHFVRGGRLGNGRVGHCRGADIGNQEGQGQEFG